MALVFVPEMKKAPWSGATKWLSPKKAMILILIPAKYNEHIRRLRSKAGVVDLSKELKISSGIVVGRYHHLTKKFNFFNGLRRTFEWF